MFINDCIVFFKTRLGILLGMTVVLIPDRLCAAPDFAKDIQPILERSCYECHSSKKQKNGYRLDIRDHALKGGDSGKPAILPHNSKGSPLIHFVSGEDAELTMPPLKSKAPRLSKIEVQLLKDWIDAGPSWPDDLAGSTPHPQSHWSLRPLVKTDAPNTQLHPVDAFIRSELSTKKIHPSPEADRRTMIRRLSYDLTGLPPTLQELELFIKDQDPNAYDKLVGRLLNSPRYGERWARHWLDTIHFADSHGYEHDIGRDHAWRFRDYVIDALNRDTPWPRFIREQLATDVFYPDEPKLTPALGYLGAGTFDLSTYSTGPVTFDYLDRDDMVAQTMSSFVSTTANCARCHDHKFDPIPQEDYYALQAVFSGVLKGDLYYLEDLTAAREFRRLKALTAAIEKKDSGVLLSTENRPLVEQWLARQNKVVQWQPLEIDTFLSAEGSTLSRTTNGVILSDGKRPDKDSYTLTAKVALTNITALRLDVLSRDSLPMRGPGRNDNGNFHLSEIELRIFENGSNQSQLVKFKNATADFNQGDWGIERAIDGDIKTAWGIHPSVGQSHQAAFEFKEPLHLKPGGVMAITLKQQHGGGHLIGAFKLFATHEDASNVAILPSEVEQALGTPVGQRTESHHLAIATQVLRLAATEALAKLPEKSVVYAAAASVNLVDSNPPGPVKTLPEPKIVNVLHRGDFDKPRAIANPGALSAITNLTARFSLKDEKNEGSRRAALADWLANPQNVLTWRSIVNRVWHYHFGRGLSDTPSDFGRMGGVPSHPELLDWLAVWFRDEAKGSLKELHRLIVTSATYRQSSRHRQDAAMLDAENRLLWRQNRVRLDADAYRDFTMAASGSLDLKMGGPAVKHFKQGPGPQLTPALDYSGFDWTQPGVSRRSIYRYVWRGIADPFMEALDFPDLGLLSPSRTFSASSLQALTLYNNDFVLHHSEMLATRSKSHSDQLAAQINQAAQSIWLRPLSQREQRDFLKYAETHGLSAVCRLLLNSNEFLFVE